MDDLHDLHELDMNTPEDDAQYYLKMDEKVTESLQSNIQVPTCDQLTIFFHDLEQILRGVLFEQFKDIYIIQRTEVMQFCSYFRSEQLLSSGCAA